MDSAACEEGKTATKKNNVTVKNDFSSPSFKGWREMPTEKKKPAEDINKLKNMLFQKQRLLNSCDARLLPDGGQRIIDQIEKLKMEIEEAQQGMTTEDTTKQEHTISRPQVTTRKDPTRPRPQDITRKEPTRPVPQDTTRQEPTELDHQDTFRKETTEPGPQDTTKEEPTRPVPQDSTQEPTGPGPQDTTRKKPLEPGLQDKTRRELPVPYHQDTFTRKKPTEPGPQDKTRREPPVTLQQNTIGTTEPCHLDSTRREHTQSFRPSASEGNPNEQSKKPIVWAGPPPSCANHQVGGARATNQTISTFRSQSVNKPQTVYSKPVIWAGPTGHQTHVRSLVQGNQFNHSVSSGTVRPTMLVLNPKKIFFKPDIRTRAPLAPFHSDSKSRVNFAGPGPRHHVHSVIQGNHKIAYHNVRLGPPSTGMAAWNTKEDYSTKSEVAKPVFRKTLPTEPHFHRNFQGLWSDGNRQTFYGGRMTDTRIAKVQSVTEATISSLHKSLESRPGPEVMALDPPQLRSSLLPHQRQALAWLLWRERQDPSGGVLADDMGLGKTLTLISLVLHSALDNAAEQARQKEWLNEKGLVKSKGCLVVCPASLLLQWEKEVDTHCKTGSLEVHLYHGPNREKDVHKLASYGMVITTYTILVKDVGDYQEEKEEDEIQDLSKAPVLLRIVWERIILDEAHTIKNPKSKCCNAVCLIRATHRWAMTGTPIHNDLEDMYSLIRFLRVSPFDEQKVWKKWVGNKTSQGKERLGMLIKSLLLRRTKDDFNESGKPLVPLPTKSIKVHSISLSEKEREVYGKLDKQIRLSLNNMLKIKAATDSGLSKRGPNRSQVLLFTWLLRLQQACNHLALLVKNLKESKEADELTNQLKSLTVQDNSSPPCAQDDVEEHSGKKEDAVKGSALERTNELAGQLKSLTVQENSSPEGEVEKHPSEMNGAVEGNASDRTKIKKEPLSPDDDDDLTGKLKCLSVQDNSDKPDCDDEEVIDLAQYLNDKDFDNSSESTKVATLLKELKQIAAQKDKSVVVSQWTSMLDIVAHHLRKNQIVFAIIQGDVSVKNRMFSINNFNDPSHEIQVMLVSLKAGGVGLNLTGGNHLFLLDVHWNPALENQACDRVFRFGQTKPVTIHRFICKDTIEEKIQDLQSQKLELARTVLSGDSKACAHLTLEDLKQLFSV